MANKRKHIGVIRHTVPKPQVFYGCNQECADKLGITLRGFFYIASGKIECTKTGWKIMTEEEYAEHYQPPKPPPPKKKSNKVNVDRRHWRLWILKDWKASDPYPQEKDRSFTGTMSEFAKHVGCQNGQVTRLVNTHIGVPEKHPLKTYKGWRICRIRKLTGKELRTRRVWDKEKKAMVYVRDKEV